MPRVDAAEKLRGEARLRGRHRACPGMLHGKVLRSPLPARPHRVHRHVGRGGAAGRGRGAHGRRPRWTSIPTGATPSRTGPSWPSTGSATWASRSRRSPPSTRPPRRPPSRPSWSTTRSCPVVGTLDEALAPDAPLVHDGPIRPGLFHGLGTLPRSATATSAIATRSTHGDVDGRLRERRHRGRGRLHVPGRLPVRDGDAHASSPTRRGRRHHAVGHLPASRSSCAPRSPTCSACRCRRVRVIVPYLGGGFGSKSYTKMEPITVALARKAGRPVRIVNRVDESMATTRRHGARIRMRTAADARRPPAGARGRRSPSTPAPTPTTGRGCRHRRRRGARARTAGPPCGCDAACVHTNTAPSGSYRAFGASHLQWAGELQVDEVGRRAGLDAAGDAAAQPAAPGRGRAPRRQAARRRPRGRRREGRRRARLGRAACPRATAAASRWACWRRARTRSRSAVVRLESDGEAVVLVGSTEMGQGQRTAFAQIAAEVLGMPAERVRCLGTDTQFTPYDRSTGASRSTTLAGLAVQRAAQAGARRPARHRPLDLARRAPTSHRARGRRRLVRRRVAHLPAAHRQALRAVRRPAHRRGRRPSGRAPARTPRARSSGRSASAAAEVSVDRETGQVTVERTATVADVGRAINPQLVERQDEGATMQGIGNALFEELRLRRRAAAQRQPARVPRALHATTCRAARAASSSRTATARGPSGPRAAARAPSRASSAPSPPRSPTPGCPVTALPLTPERVWRSIQPGKTGTRRRRSSMSRFRTRRGHGHRHHGPGHGGGPRARRDDRCALYDTSAEAHRARQGHVRHRLGRPRQARDARQGWRLGAATRATWRRRSTAPTLVIEAVPEKLELKKQVFAEYEQHVGPEVLLASNTSGIPITKIAEDLAASRAGRRARTGRTRRTSSP